MTSEERRYEKALAELEPLPGILTEIVKVLDDELSSARDVERVMGYDQAITARVLKLANSAFYGRSGKVKTLAQAITLIGFRTSLRIALGLGLKQCLSSGEGGTEAYSTDYWVHSLVVGLFARGLGEYFSSERSDDLFLAGMMHDVGWNVLTQMPLESSLGSSTCEEENPLLSHEHRTFGADHQSVGAELLLAWGFPDTIVKIVRNHHSPESAPESVERDTHLLHLADHSAVQNNFSFDGDRSLSALTESTRARFIQTQEAADTVLGFLARESELTTDLVDAFLG